MSVLRCSIVLLSLAVIGFAEVDYKNASIKTLADDVMVLGEGPFWDAENNILYFVDILQHRVYRYFQSHLEHVQLNDTVGFVIPVAGQQGLFVIGLGTTLASLRWNLNEKTHKVVPLATLNQSEPGVQWNDAKADLNGNLWAGTISFQSATGNLAPGHSALYKLSDTGCFQNLESVLQNITISNGPTWSSDGTRMYYTDSPTNQIVVFDYDPATVSISNRKTFYDLKTDNITGGPDGMTTDSKGNLWIAIFDGAEVLHVCGSSGKLLGKLKIAAERVSSVTFGGPYLDKLYVTTVSLDIPKDKFKEYPLTGKILEISGLGVTGTPNHRIRENCF